MLCLKNKKCLLLTGMCVQTSCPGKMKTFLSQKRERPLLQTAKADFKNDTGGTQHSLGQGRHSC